MSLFQTQRRPFAGETILTSGAGVHTLTRSIFDGNKVAKEGVATGALITVEAESIKYTVEGTNPSTTIGHTVLLNDPIVLDTYDEIQTFKFIRTGATDARIYVTYFRK